MKIVIHSLVKNEENFIWYALKSVLDFVDEALVWDMGSTDKTAEIVKSINSDKIKYQKVPDKGSEKVGFYRNKMLEATKGDWILILDGDEIWWQASISNLLKEISEKENQYNLVVSPNYMLLGDMYHYQERKAGQYQIGGRKGHYNIRLIRNLKGLQVKGIYPNEAYETLEGIKIQDLAQEKILFSKNAYLHASFLRRSSKDQKKLKYEIGEEFPKDFYYPEVFFQKKPDEVIGIWFQPGFGYKLRALMETPLKRIKRRLR